MRSDGDKLLQHVSVASGTVLLCAPFIKAPVLRRLFQAVPEGVAIEVVTRWHPKEVAAGVSDLETFEIVAGRENASLRLLDNLHAKLYVAGDAVLAGSANLTAPALGWCKAPNLEILMPVPKDSIEVQACIGSLKEAREATEAERDRVRELASKIKIEVMPAADPMEPELASPWLPRSGGPARLYQVYTGQGVDRLTSSTVEAARYDLEALAVPKGLPEPEFDRAVAARFVAMPTMHAIMEGIADDLADAEAITVLEGVNFDLGMTPESQWHVIKEWFMHFMPTTIEVAPQSYIVRRKPGASRS
jgi:hypothetical protein